ncbi:MAG: sterol desaturase family protein [Acidobacteria bacterium]|nr:sterol desaturase family protein [Acidobacteriota bacterium]
MFFAIMTPLERLFALRREQKIFRAGWRTDVVHFLVDRFLIDAGSAVLILILMVFWHWIVSPDFQAGVAAQPFLLQFFEAVLVVDIIGYFYHRWTHTSPFLWKIHSVHHSPTQMDWLAGARIHPLDQIFHRAVTFVPLYALGFTKETFGAYLVFGAIQALFIHSNVRFRFGFLRWIVATPEYHHWHHSRDPEAQNKNFAGQLPFLDWIFGTAYLPKNKRPQAYGISEPMPPGYWAQLKYPFANK